MDDPCCGSCEFLFPWTPMPSASCKVCFLYVSHIISNLTRTLYFRAFDHAHQCRPLLVPFRTFSCACVHVFSQHHLQYLDKQTVAASLARRCTRNACDAWSSDTNWMQVRRGTVPYTCEWLVACWGNILSWNLPHCVLDDFVWDCIIMWWGIVRTRLNIALGSCTPHVPVYAACLRFRKRFVVLRILLSRNIVCGVACAFKYAECVLHCVNEVLRCWYSYSPVWKQNSLAALVVVRGLSFLYLFNTVPRHSLKHNSQRLNRRNRGLVLVTSWSKELILIKVCRG